MSSQNQWNPKVSFFGFEDGNAKAKKLQVQALLDQKQALKDTITLNRRNDDLLQESIERFQGPVVERLEKANERLLKGLFDSEDAPKLDKTNKKLKKVSKKLDALDALPDIDNKLVELAKLSQAMGSLASALQNQPNVSDDISGRDLVGLLASPENQKQLKAINNRPGKQDLDAISPDKFEIFGVHHTIDPNTEPPTIKVRNLNIPLTNELTQLLVFPVEAIKQVLPRPKDKTIDDFVRIALGSLTARSYEQHQRHKDKLAYLDTLKPIPTTVAGGIKELFPPESVITTPPYEDASASTTQSSPPSTPLFSRALQNNPPTGRGMASSASASAFAHIKGNPYTVRPSGDFGVLNIDLSKLHMGHLVATINGVPVLERFNVPQGTILLLAQRYANKHAKEGKYTPEAIKLFKKVVVLSQLPPFPRSEKYRLLTHMGGSHTSAHKRPQASAQLMKKQKKAVEKKQKKKSGTAIIVGGPDELVKIMEKSILSMEAGNDSLLLRNQLSAIIDSLLNMGVLDRKRHKLITKAYLK